MKEDSNAVNNAVTIATLTTTLTFMQSQLSEIRAELKAINSVFASKEELLNTAKITEDRIYRLERQSNLWRWLSPTLAAVVGAALSYLLQYWLTGNQK